MYYVPPWAGACVIRLTLQDEVGVVLKKIQQVYCVYECLAQGTTDGYLFVDENSPKKYT